MQPANFSAKRRSILANVVSVASLCAVGDLMAGAVRDPRSAPVIGEPVVQTQSGKLRGQRRAGEVTVFRGIPYGASTAGANRFRPSLPPAPWSGVRDALYFAPMAMQRPVTGREYLRVLQGLYPRLPYPVSEDCLALNIWTPELGRETRRPVMVWLHPGGFAAGAGNSAWSDGRNLALKHDVVVVSLNHRLGIFGHLYLGGVAGREYVESGNVGMLDIVSALDWVQNNIRNFGGDPDNVTIFGESGGAAKVSALMAMPAAKGSFHKAIIQSDALVEAQPVQRASETTLQLMAQFGLAGSDVDQLQRLTADKLLDAKITGYFGPVVDGVVIPRPPFALDSPAVSSEVPLLTGTTQDEGMYFALMDPSLRRLDEAALAPTLVKWYAWEGIDDVRSARLVKAYRDLHPTSAPNEAFFGIATDMLLADVTLQAERKATRAAAPVYKYLFAWKSPAFGGQYRSCHTFDVPFVFDNIDAAPQLWGESPDFRRYELAARISKAWAAFAHSGNPSHSTLPQWRSYTMSERATMILNYSCALASDPGGEERRAFDEARGRV